MSAMPQPDPFERAAAGGQRAVKTFLPSISTPPQPPPTPPNPMAYTQPAQDAMRGLAMAAKVEGMSKRAARGLPPIKPPTPEEQFGNSLDIVHTRALSAAIAAHPEEDRDRLISEAHDSAVKWIASHNGKVVVHGKVEIAGGTESAEKLAAKIVNGSVEDHDQRKEEEAQRAAGILPGGDGDAAGKSGRVRSGDDNGGNNTGATPADRQMAIDPVYPNPKGITPLLDTEVDPRDTTQLGSGAKFDNSLAPLGRSPADTSNPPTTQIIPPADVPSGTGTAVGASPQVSGRDAARGSTGVRQGGPQIVPPGDETAIPKGPPPSVSPTEAAKVGSANRDGEQITQPKNSIAANQKLAIQSAPELHDALMQMTSKIPGLKFDKLRPLKDRGRMDQKLDDQNDPNTLSDYLGAQIAADSPQAKDAIVQELQKNFNVIENDDHFLTGKPDKAHYPSANLQLQVSNGSTAEVQIVPREVQDTQDESHVFYKAGREAEDKGDNAERDRQWAKAEKIHTAQLEKFKVRNGIGSASTITPRSTQGQGVAQSDQGGDRDTVDPHGPLRQALDSAGVKPIKLGGKLFYALDSGNGKPVSAEAGNKNNILPEQSGESNPRTNIDPESNVAPAPMGVVSVQRQKGDTVTLPDGTQGEVAYHDPAMNVLRVRVNGKNLLVNPKDVQ